MLKEEKRKKGENTGEVKYNSENLREEEAARRYSGKKLDRQDLNHLKRLSEKVGKHWTDDYGCDQKTHTKEETYRKEKIHR